MREGNIRSIMAKEICPWVSEGIIVVMASGSGRVYCDAGC